ncbi:MAG: HAD hydrolase-like protein [Phycisphaeraceae bacterium]|nr:HAD hydrolase-like protein [Phycisphaeraceae bacterium]
MAKLVLFDIDATLITTAGLGVRAMVQAGHALFGPGFHADGLQFGGGLDPVLIREMFRVSGVQPTADRVSQFRERYERELAELLVAAPVKRALPGVANLLSTLRAVDGTVVGLLTGNFEPTGLMKLEACGIPTTQFAVRVWGDDSPHDPPDRAHLPPVAMERYARLTASRIDSREVVIIGDTPHDVRAARESGCRSLGVATGRHGVEELSHCGADRVVPDLSQTDELVRWITQP